jgi:GNAT superfamily N-acetyltransferase
VPAPGPRGDTGPASSESGPCGTVDVDLLDPGDWRDLKTARLAALKDSPKAFVATLAREQARTAEEWIASLEEATWAVARDGGKVVGIACLTAAEPSAPQERFIQSVWVRLGYREQGVGRRMMQRLELAAWAGGAQRIKLWVLVTNDVAYRAYKKLDFHDPEPEIVQYPEEPRGDGKRVQERLMVKPLL